MAASPPTLRTLLASMGVAIALTSLIVAGGILRLRRVARGQRQVVIESRSHRLVLERLFIARPHADGGVLLGWSVRCAGAELLADRGPLPQIVRVHTATGDERWTLERAGHPPSVVLEANCGLQAEAQNSLQAR
ncbi:MAG: hypothetical protein Q8Q09_13645 [Deltaproteobacteria bacterium]|nr:hypothetical protein [Deltaproteobacteria bacterium]